MSLSGIGTTLLPDLLKKNFCEEIFKLSETEQYVSVRGYAGSAPSLFVAEMFVMHKRTVLFISDDKEKALYAASELEDLAGAENVLYFPATHLEPYETEKTQNANLVLRTEVINSLVASDAPKIIVTSAGALAEKVLKREDFKAISHRISTGEKINFDFTEELLSKFDFTLTDFVSEPGEFSVRGGIVDVFSYSAEKPYRIVFFGNEVESIKTFDIETQLTQEKVDSFQLVSNMNFAPTAVKVPLFGILPENSAIVAENLFLAQNTIGTFFERAIEKFDTLSKDIKHSVPQEIFLSKNEFQAQLLKYSLIDFSPQDLSLIHI